MTPSTQTAFGSAPALPTGGNPRMTEAWALTEAARRMEQAQQEPFEPQRLLEAVRLNWRLWTIFQSELCAPDCPVPSDTRGNMLSLANFIDKRSTEILADPEPSKASILITINKEIAVGLFASPQAA